MDGIGSFTELLGKVSAAGFLRYSRLPEAPYPPEFPLPALQILDRDLRRLTFHFFFLFPFHGSLHRSLGELVYDHGSGGSTSGGGGAAPEEDSEEEDSSDQEEEQDVGGAPPDQFEGDPELPVLGEGGSGVYICYDQLV
jgi:hypothetical protein